MLKASGNIPCKIIFEIRKARKSDLDELSDVMRYIPNLRIGDELPFSSADELESCITNKKGLFLVYVKNDQIVGFLYGVMETENTACIVYLGIVEGFRHHGFATELVDKFIIEMNNKISITKIYTLTTNEIATGFFENVYNMNEKANLAYLSKDVGELWDSIRSRKTSDDKIVQESRKQ